MAYIFSAQNYSQYFIQKFVYSLMTDKVSTDSNIILVLRVAYINIEYATGT